jgi:hypothetical protein
MGYGDLLVSVDDTDSLIGKSAASAWIWMGEFSFSIST